MIRDPYELLGVACDATDEQIKAAYRDLARKHHPDNFSNPEEAAQAEERMKAINEAYDLIRRRRSDPRPEEETPRRHDPFYAGIRGDIRAGRFDQADLALEQVPVQERGGEWSFLKGCVLTQKGWYFDAQKYLETACYLDPDNQEYRDFLSGIRTASAKGGGYRADAPGSRSGICDVCLSIACLDCLCDCFGGDFIRCF